MTRASFLANLKVEYGYEANAAALKALKRVASKQDSLFYPNHPLTGVSEREAVKTIITIGERVATVADFVDYLNIVKVRNPEAGAASIIDKKFQEWTDKLLLDYEDERLEAKHDDFRLLM